MRTIVLFILICIPVAVCNQTMVGSGNIYPDPAMEQQDTLEVFFNGIVRDALQIDSMLLVLMHTIGELEKINRELATVTALIDTEPDVESGNAPAPDIQSGNIEYKIHWRRKSQ